MTANRAHGRPDAVRRTLPAVGLNKQVATAIAEQQLAAWRDSVTYAELHYLNDNNSVQDSEVAGPDGITYRVSRVVYREQHDTDIAMQVKVSEAGRRSLFRSVTRQGRMSPDGRFTDGF